MMDRPQFNDKHSNQQYLRDSKQPSRPNRWIRRSVLLLLATICSSAASASAQIGSPDAQRTLTTSQAEDEPKANFPALGKEVVELVKQRFYDSEQAQAWVQQNGDYAAKIESRETFNAETKRVLAALKTSHTNYYTPDEYAYYGIWSIFHPVFELPAREVSSIGVELDAEHFIRWVLPGGAADQAGLRRGSRLVTAGGKPFHPIRSFQGLADQPVELGVLEQKDGEPKPVTVRPRLVIPKQEWLDAQRSGAKIVQVDGKSVAYVSLYSCAGMDPLNLLRELLTNELKTAEALVLDFRFGWGGCPTEFVNLFNRQPPILEMRPRGDAAWIMDAQWRKPVVLLINGGSRSGKEAVAYSMKKNQLAKLVGEKTAGAVVAGSCFRLSDESLVYLAVSDVRVDGVRLEGVGVAPDVTVSDDYRFNGGKDPQLDRALQEAAEMIRPSSR